MAVLKQLSKVRSIPGLSLVSPAQNHAPTEEEKEGHLRAQRLAFQAVREVASFIQEGWTEIQAAQMINRYLKDAGVVSSFHHGFAWFGERCGFEGIKSYKDFMPSHRVIRPGEAFILDVAPIFRGYVSDIGYTSSLGENQEVAKAIELLKYFREEIPKKFMEKNTGGEIWKWIEHQIEANGYANAYKKYPFSVVGHRVHRVPEWSPQFKYMNFGWQSFWSIASRGVFGQLLNQNFEGDLVGLWAIEPHLSGKTFGAKFEEILVVSETESYWLDSKPGWY